jgi:transmembrane sensor
LYNGCYMDKKALYNLLGKYLDGRCTPEETKLIDDWLELLQDDQSFAAYTRSDLDVIHSRIWEKIQAQTFVPKIIEEPILQKPEAGRSRSLVIGRWVAAACVAGIMAFAGYRILQVTKSTDQTDFASIIPSTGMLKQVNRSAVAVKLVLEDSSVVMLDPGTTLNYPLHFEKSKREVYLEGKAFFEVSKNAKRPFYIYHNSLVTHVIGTSFVINTRKEGNKAEVSVLTGRVEVSEGSLCSKEPHL